MARALARREFLGVAGAAALGLMAGCSGSHKSRSAVRRPSGTESGGSTSLPSPGDAPFDTIVVLMMENRSFDHILGWLPGADGQQQGLSFTDATGRAHQTHALAPDFQGCRFHDPKHDWQSVAKQYNDGRCDGWLRTGSVGDLFPIGYYTARDLPVTATLARGYTVCDRYFCSVLGPTGPNRMYAWSATTDYLEFDGILSRQGPRPSRVPVTIWDRLAGAGISHGYYAGKEPTSYQYASRKYDSITHSQQQFFDAATRGTLPHVAFVDPDLGTFDEFSGIDNDDHPFGDVRQGEAWIAQIYRALAASPQWDRLVFVLTFDEHGGFYDHVPPPRVADDTVLSGPGPDLDRLGFRVPCIVIGPYASARVFHDGPYEHCSILRMIEWRWNLAPMTARDRHARNLAEVLDFARSRAPTTLAAFEPGPPSPCSAQDVAARVANGGP